MYVSWWLTQPTLFKWKMHSHSYTEYLLMSKPGCCCLFAWPACSHLSCGGGVVNPTRPLVAICCRWSLRTKQPRVVRSCVKPAQTSWKQSFSVTPNRVPCFIYVYFSSSVKSRADEPPQIPHIPAVLLAGLSASVRGTGSAGRLGVSSPATGPAPPREAGARKRRRQQD